MKSDPVSLLKNTERTNSRDWLRETSIVSYGVVTDVVSDGIVTVAQVVRDSVSLKTLNVPLLCLSGSLAEEGAQPQEGDLVLLLFVDKAAPGMFDSPQARFQATNDWTLFSRNATGYNKFSAVGILMQPFKGMATTVRRHAVVDGVPTYSFKTKASFQGLFRREFNLLFDAAAGDTGFVDRLCQVTFGQHSPFQLKHWAAVTREYGFSVLPDQTLEAVTAPVVEMFSQYSPITKNMQGNQTEDSGLAYDPPGNFASTTFKEVVNTVQKTYHGKVSLTLDIRGPSTFKFGIGNAETGNPTADRNAPVMAQFGAQASLTITSKSFFSATFQGPIDLKTTTADKLTFGNSLGTLGAEGDAFWGALTAFMTTVSSATTAPQIAAAAATLLLTWPAARVKWNNTFV